MLEHETTGRHYVCSQSDLSDGVCQDRATKSGASVSVCSCKNSDFCNQKMWPLDEDEAAEDSANGGLEPLSSFPTASASRQYSRTSSFFQLVISSLFSFFTVLYVM